MKVRYTELLPWEFRQRLAEQPVAYIPLGTLEWHGEHLPLGSDIIQAEGLMVTCAERFGGIVLPPFFLGPDRVSEDGRLMGIELDESVDPPRSLDGNCYWVPTGLFRQILECLLAQVKRAGFKAVFAHGHGPSYVDWTECIEDREKRHGLKLLGVTRAIRRRWKVQVDHAGKKETSLVQFLTPDLPELEKLPRDRRNWPEGVTGQDPRDASAHYGKLCLELSVEIVRQMFIKAGLLT